MTTIDALPDQQREVLRLLFFSPDHTATADAIKGSCYYPDHEVTTALEQLRNQRLIQNVTMNPAEPARWSPSEEMLEQMRAKNRQANADLKKAVDKVKPFLKDEDDDEKAF